MLKANGMKKIVSLIVTVVFLSAMHAQEFNTLVWSDEGDGSGMIDTSKWYHQTQLPNGNSWYNSEIQHYTDRVENSFYQDGYLYIKAIKETFTDQGVTKEHTSARLNSKFAFTYGRVEVRAALPFGVGTWPAIWTLGRNISEPGAYWQPTHGTTGWPACGEIDIMEHWGTNQNYVSSAIHTPSSYGATVNVGGVMLDDVSNTYHIYAMEWTEDKIEFSIDGDVHYTYEPQVKNAETWPFDKPQYLLLNIAIQPSIQASFTESNMVIDYVRVYQELPTGVEEKGEQGFELFPNPSNGGVQVNLPPNFQGGSISVNSLDGKLVSQEGNVTRLHRLDTSSLEQGMYIVQAMSPEGEVLTERLVVE
jgi:beta-glucanase (GH16 family)